MRNVAPSRTLIRRSRRLLEVAFVVATAGIFIAVVGLALYVVPLASGEGGAFGIYNIARAVFFIGGVMLGFVGLGLAIRAVTFKTENDVAFVVGEHLRPNLGEEYTYIHNINQRATGYIDAVLVGPAGVLVFRTLDLTGTFLNEGSKWLKETRSGSWQPMFSNPTEDTIEDIKSMKQYLADRDLPDMPIFGVVVFLKDDPIVKLTLKDSVIPATHLTSLYMRLQKGFLAKDRLAPAQVKAIVKLLYDQE